MSLLDHGPDVVDIWPQVESVDDRGNVVQLPAPAPVRVHARVQPVSSDDLAVAGQQVTTVYRLITRDAPLGPWARVEWAGRQWDVAGEPLRSAGSPATRHVTALLRARDGG